MDSNETLSEVEQLKAENSRLSAELEQARYLITTCIPALHPEHVSGVLRAALEEFLVHPSLRAPGAGK